MLDIYEKANNFRYAGTYSGVFEINGNSISGILKIKDKIEISLAYSNSETFVDEIDQITGEVETKRFYTHQGFESCMKNIQLGKIEQVAKIQNQKITRITYNCGEIFLTDSHHSFNSPIKSIHIVMPFITSRWDDRAQLDRFFGDDNYENLSIKQESGFEINLFPSMTSELIQCQRGEIDEHFEISPSWQTLIQNQIILYPKRYIDINSSPIDDINNILTRICMFFSIVYNFKSYPYVVCFKTEKEGQTVEFIKAEWLTQKFCSPDNLDAGLDFNSFGDTDVLDYGSKIFSADEKIDILECFVNYDNQEKDILGNIEYYTDSFLTLIGNDKYISLQKSVILCSIIEGLSSLDTITTDDAQKKLIKEINSVINHIDSIDDRGKQILVSRFNNCFYPALKDCIHDIIQNTQILMLIFNDEVKLNNFVKMVYENRNIPTHQGSIKKIETGKEKLSYVAQALSIIVRIKILNEITENKYSEKFKELQSHVIGEIKNKTY